ncbi:MAG: hypothetical protein JRH11_23915 [Deltaproteobacteria bacterium]|nr:hypothetical protein [Deltaproteobacteria bacterium]
MEFAKTGNVAGGVTDLKREASQRGHGQQTAFAGAGGFLGGILGSFRGPFGAAFGALLGAFFGALLGQRRDRGVVATLPRGNAAPRRELTRHAVIEVPDETLYVDAVYRD